MEEVLKRMRRRVLSHAPRPDGVTAITNLFLSVLPHRTVPTMRLCDPMLCVVLQGVKEVLIGGSVLRFEAASCFVSTVELPATGCILDADAERPYIAVALILNLDALASLASEVASKPEPAEKGVRTGFAVEQTTSTDVLEALDAVLALLERPGDIGALGPGREREVLYRLLQSGHGNMLRQAIRKGDGTTNIRRSAQWIRQNLSKKLRTEELAAVAGMSVSSFHRHFKEMTSLSPLQYQKTLRLQAARKLLVTSSNATQAAFAVGYESASQFSREYSRLFGISPAKDAVRSRGSGKFVFGYMI